LALEGPVAVDMLGGERVRTVAYYYTTVLLPLYPPVRRVGETRRGCENTFADTNKIRSGYVTLGNL